MVSNQSNACIRRAVKARGHFPNELVLQGQMYGRASLTCGDASPESRRPGISPRSSAVVLAALKCVYMAIMSLNPTGTDRRRWMMRWKPALNTFEMTFDGRLAAGRK